jgi:hypothetical protein
VINNGHLLCFRWLEPHVEPRKVSGQTKLAVPNNRHHLVQAQMGQFHHQSRGHDEHPSANYQDFLSTQAPLFHKADKPLDADAWLRTMESKFALLSAPCFRREQGTLCSSTTSRHCPHMVGPLPCHIAGWSCCHMG